MAINLSVLIPVRPDAPKLSGCLKSIKDLADEIVILVDSDEINTKSEKLAKKYNAVVINKYIKNNFAKKRNLLAKQAKGKWLFYIDDDERATPELVKDIRNIISDNAGSAYAIPRKNIIFKKHFKYGGQSPDYVIRLFKKENLIKWEGQLHEQPKYKGELVHLKSKLIHHKHDELSEMVDKTNEWSEVEAKLMLDANHPPMNIRRFVTAMLREFWLRMIKQTAFLDGPKGIIYALYQVFSRFISYAKLWEMQITKK